MNKTKKNTARKSIALLMMLLMLLVLAAGCGGKADAQGTPSGAVEKCLQAIKDGDESALKECYAGDASDLTNIADTGGVSSYESMGIDEETTKELRDKLMEFDYETGKEAVDGDQGTVDTTIKTYNVGSLLSSWFKDYMAWVTSEAMTGEYQQDELTQKGVDMFMEAFKDIKKDYKKTVEIPVEKKDGKWMVSDISNNEEVIDALTGGAVSGAKEMLSGVSDVLGDDGE